ncbi:MAG: DUF3524 domain-containing protein [Pseudohongiellaceae bacterium]
MKNKKMLVLSAYDAISHKLWRERLQALFDDVSWTELSLAPRHFSWRIRGNSLLWASKEKELLSQDYDLLIATSMVDLSSLRGFIPSLAQIPTLLYVHENQFAYPTNRSNKQNAELMLVPLYAALCADAVAFNSDFNRRSFLAGADALLKKLPDQFPESIMEKLQESTVVPVPLPKSEPRSRPASRFEPLSVVWNHRWEYDKGPELLLAIVSLITRKELRIKLDVVGQQFRQQPREFEEIDELLTIHSDSTAIKRGLFGFVDNSADYHALLSSSDVVLSTAEHDFQGLAVQEACLKGCVPLTPDALAYPEYIPPKNRFAAGANVEATAKAAVAMLISYQDQKLAGTLVSDVDLSDYQGDTIKQAYQRKFDDLLGIYFER